MPQDPLEIEASYSKPDPWGYKSNPCDIGRRMIIHDALSSQLRRLLMRQFDRALDIGAGEGWITQILPARILHGYEISPSARSRFPREVSAAENPEGKYDLVVATGVLYSHYDYEKMFQMIRDHSEKIILTCNIKSWERQELSDPDWVKGFLQSKEVYSAEFPYREYQQKLRIFQKL
jgi:hypothetical protein